MQIKKKAFHRSRFTWRLTWSIGTVFLALHKATGYNFYWIHVYLILIGGISVLFSIFPYFTVNEVGITFYYNRFLPFKKIIVPWNKIRIIKLKEIKRQFHFTAGARIHAPATFDVKKSVVYIVLKKIDNKNELISKLGRGVIFNDFIFSDKEAAVIIAKAPSGGFNPLVDGIKEKMDYRDLADNISVKGRKYIVIVDILIVLAFLYFIF